MDDNKNTSKKRNQLITSHKLSRRDFLKLGSTGLAGAAFLGNPPGQALAGPSRFTLAAHGTQISFDRRGRIVMLTQDNSAVPLSNGPSGLYLENPTTRGRRRVSGSLHRQGNSLHQHATLHNANLEVNVKYRLLSSGEMRVDGAVQDTTGRDRVVDVVFHLPVQAIGGRWQKNTVEQAPITRSTRGSARLVQNARGSVPLTAIIGPKQDFALAYAIPPDHPVRFQFSYDRRSGFSIRLKFGLSPAASGALHSRAPFSFVVDLVDPRWGLRDALRRYYRRHPHVFTNKIDRYGLWQTGAPRSYSSYDPTLYAFHEAGKDRDGASTVQEYAAHDGWNSDQRHSLYTFPYINAGNLLISNLDTLPSGNVEIVAALKTWKHAPGPFAALNHPNTYTDTASHKDRIRNSASFDPKGKYETKIRHVPWDWDNNRNIVQFVVNSNPALFSDSDKTTIGKNLLNEYVPKLLKSPLVDGFYVDSLKGWGSHFNYRREHFSYAQTPLTYDESVMQPAIFNAISELEFLWALRRKLRSQGKFIMANSGPVNPGMPFLNFPLDVVGLEGGAGLAHPVQAAQYRAMAAQKPLVGLYNDWDSDDPARVDRLVKNAALQGATVASNPENTNPYDQLSKRELAYQRRYVPVVQQMAKAGWAPATGVHTNDPAVHSERYGDQNSFYLAFYNTSGVQKKLTFNVDHDILHWPSSGRIQDVLASQKLSPDQSRALLKKGRIMLDAGEFTVLHFSNDPSQSNGESSR